MCEYPECDMDTQTISEAGECVDITNKICSGITWNLDAIINGDNQPT